MPSRDKKIRQGIWHKWKRNNPDKHRENSRRGVSAKHHHPVRKKCSIDNCDNLGERHHPDPDKHDEIIWLCKFHHTKEHYGPERKCSLNGCERKHTARGFCHAHYKQTRRARGYAHDTA